MGLIIPWRWPGRPTNDDAEDEQEGEHADHPVLDEAAEDRADIGSAARLFGCSQERDQVRDLGELLAWVCAGRSGVGLGMQKAPAWGPGLRGRRPIQIGSFGAQELLNLHAEGLL
ncbi:hypothetical protein ACFWVP_18300 [Streptomyces sp. NPDC058637]|uniref:hypothetical protein n=1 Tax=Streptomyces sp. NPDC058637 TaxID=3346569 RepID=UPI0036490F31